MWLEPAVLQAFLILWACLDYGQPNRRREGNSSPFLSIYQ